MLKLGIRGPHQTTPGTYPQSPGGDTRVRRRPTGRLAEIFAEGLGDKSPLGKESVLTISA